MNSSQYLCEGGCCTTFEYGENPPGHRGIVRRVRVLHPARDFGWFHYCEEAVERDRSKGLDVIPEEEFQ